MTYLDLSYRLPTAGVVAVCSGCMYSGCVHASLSKLE